MKPVSRRSVTTGMVAPVTAVTAAALDAPTAIRKAEPQTVFGIGVKLVTEHFEEFDVVEANEDARRSLAALTGYDFIAETGPMREGLT